MAWSPRPRALKGQGPGPGPLGPRPQALGPEGDILGWFWHLFEIILGSQWGQKNIFGETTLSSQIGPRKMMGSC